jgi:hypothetical protein
MTTPGPRLLAGFIDAPVIEPLKSLHIKNGFFQTYAAKISNVKHIPIANGANTFLSVSTAVNKTV